MRIARPTVAVAVALASSIVFSAPSFAQVRTTASTIIEGPGTEQVVQDVLSNVAVTVTVINHLDGGFARASPAAPTPQNNLELSASSQLLFGGGLLLAEEAVSVSVGAIGAETALECGTSNCESVMVVLAQYN
ncbi:MAG TPA: hypothetical protein VGD10_09870 [Allosphingosinicella sp.]|uniref:hypothetical protein n=1 Tax=Allosphingosinicella sp. TaxID=2823234 RepID=UPI002ED9D755